MNGVSATTPLWVPLIVAALGVVGSAATAWFTQRLAKRREDERWLREREVDEIRWSRDKADRLRERRVVLYIDLAEYVQRRQSSIPVITDSVGDTGHITQPDDLIHPYRLTARAKLLAPRAVVDAWAAFDRAEDALLWEFTQEPDGTNYSGESYLNVDNKSVQEVIRTAQDVSNALRAAINDADPPE